jgi:hypothetical protein
MSFNNGQKITPSLVIEELWKEKFFEKARKLPNIKQKLESKKINFSGPAILMATKNAKFLTRSGFKGSYAFIQKIPSSIVANRSVEAREIIYGKGDAYDFYKDIKKILKEAKMEVMVVDAYVNEELLDLYLEKVLPKVRIKILTNPNTYKGNFYTVARKFALKPNRNFEVKEDNDVHDRAIFVDNDSYVVGQSLKDAGKKPTYLILVHKSNELRKVFDAVWKSAKKTI